MWKEVGRTAYGIIDEIVCSELNSESGILLSYESPYSNDLKLNLTGPAVLRQYFGEVDVNNDVYANYVPRYTYGGGMGSACKSVGTMDNYLFTRPFTKEMKFLAEVVHSLVFSHSFCKDRVSSTKFDNLSVETDKFNHCTILNYYGIKGVKNSSSLGLHCDCVFGKDGTFKNKSNSQKENTLTVSLTIGDSRVVKHFQRFAEKSNNNSFGKWELNDKEWIETVVTNGTLMVLHPHDEKPFVMKRGKKIYVSQLQHGKVSVTNNQFSAAIVFRTINNVEYYCKNSHKIVAKNDYYVTNDIPKASSIDFSREELLLYRGFHKMIKELYIKRVSWMYKSMK